jgi:hypothetical protein
MVVGGRVLARMERKQSLFISTKRIYGSGWMALKHAAFAPASQKRLDSRLRSPLTSLEEPCPLSLPYGFFTTQHEPFTLIYDVSLSVCRMSGIGTGHREDPRGCAPLVAGRGFMLSPRRGGSEQKRALEGECQLPLQGDSSLIFFLFYKLSGQKISCTPSKA